MIVLGRPRCWARLLTLSLVLIAQARAASSILFQDVTEQTGIDFQHTDGSSGRYYIVETVCAGLALFDHDNDGDEDIYFLNGGALKGTQFETPPRNALYRNEGDWRFTDDTETSGLGHGGHALGVAVADYDGDDDLDVYVTNYGPNVLFRNNGDGTFTDVSAVSGIAAHLGTGMGTVCLDHDNDGDTYIYVANDAMGNFLFCNDGSGKFEEQGLFSGVSYNMNGEKMGSMGVGCGDYDNDGLLDLYVTAYQQQFPSLYQNTGDGVFEDVTSRTGAGTGTIHTATWTTTVISTS